MGDYRVGNLQDMILAELKQRRPSRVTPFATESDKSETYQQKWRKQSTYRIMKPNLSSGP